MRHVYEQPPAIRRAMVNGREKVVADPVVALYRLIDRVTDLADHRRRDNIRYRLTSMDPDAIADIIDAALWVVQVARAARHEVESHE